MRHVWRSRKAIEGKALQAIWQAALRQMQPRPIGALGMLLVEATLPRAAGALLPA